jgi:hypothetical protein
MKTSPARFKQQFRTEAIKVKERASGIQDARSVVLTRQLKDYDCRT